MDNVVFSTWAGAIYEVYVLIWTILGVIGPGYKKYASSKAALVYKLEGCMQFHNLWLVKSFKTKKRSTF